VPQTRWVDVDEDGLVEYLCRRGLLLSAEDSEPFAGLRGRDEQLADLGWLSAAAVYHFATRFRGGDATRAADDLEEFGDLAAASDAAAGRFVERHGPPPPPFHSVSDRDSVELPLVRRQGGLYDALAARRTTRGFDRSRPLTLGQLAALLYEVFGCRGYARLHPEIGVLRKGSPSAGSLHPVEAYPLVRHVEGLAPGLYHYSVRDHALEPIEELTEAEARDELAAFTAGQVYFASAAAAFVLTARFRRSFWKYRQHPTAYATLLMDAAHLSQALYLVGADLGLGTFFTNVINDKNIDDRLGLDGIEESALAVCGCGHSSGRSRLEPEFEPYVPRETEL
jgi:putative peptide maturation dehydrogenase